MVEEMPVRPEGLSLYHYEGCPYCTRVRIAAGELGVEIELRDIYAETEHREELAQAMGRLTVPVLRVEHPEGEVRWMPESRDIVRYLHERFA